MLKFKYHIGSDEGIHARPATNIVTCAKKFISNITINNNDKTADAKRMIAIMALNAKKDDILENIKSKRLLFQNIYKEMYEDLGIVPSISGNLTCWAKEGVLLLNSVLTVRKDSPASHKNLGWQDFTDEIIRKIEEKDDVVVYILWGNFAKSKKALITNPKHFVIESVHPSPFSARYPRSDSRGCQLRISLLSPRPNGWEL